MQVVNRTDMEKSIILHSDSAVLFDLDGTLVDTAPDFLAVINKMCDAGKLAPPSTEDVHATVSSGARALVTLAFKIDTGHDNFKGLLQTLLDQYEQQLFTTQARLYPDMDRLLQLLEKQSVPWGVVTNKPERFSKPLLEKLGLLERCSVLICPDHVQQTKPHPEPLLLACARTGSNPLHSIYVGDHPRDIDAGKAAGLVTIAAAFGYLPATPHISSWGADFIVQSTNALINYLWPHNSDDRYI